MDHFSFYDFEVFLPDFSSTDLEEFFFNSYVDLGARMSLVIYLQSWSEFMTLAPSISCISPRSHKT
jgi:hypothetical protein